MNRNDQKTIPQLPIRAIIVTYEPDLSVLGTLIGSLKEQTYPVEITIWDNGSRKVPVARFAEERGVEIHASRRNRGFGEAVHRAVMRARERLVLILNWDIWLDAKAVEEMVRVYRSEPGVGAVCPKILWAPDPRFIDSVGTGVDPFLQAYNRGIGEPDLGQYDVVESPLGACFAAVLLDRAAYLAIGGMDSRYFLYYEDIDYSIRLRRAGYQIRTAPRAIAYHLHSAGVSRFPEHFKHYYIKRNLVWTALKHLPASRLLGFFAFILSVAVTESRLRKRWALNWVKILGSVVLNLPRLLFLRWSYPGEGSWIYLVEAFPETYFDASARKPERAVEAEAAAKGKRFALTGEKDDWLAFRRVKAMRERGFSLENLSVKVSGLAGEGS
jgi:GT2 family glycosyltransferase